MKHHIKEKIISKTKYVEHIIRTAAGYSREVIKLPLGGQVLPYFKDNRNAWRVVLVNQYRPAVLKKTIEAAGGQLDYEPAETALSRELLEETGIKVNPESIKIVINEYTHPSILNTCSTGGIVKINQRMVKNKRKAGNNHENEQTQVEIFDLIKLIKKREANLITLDLITSRLIDEVAKTVGLLVKKY